MDQLDMQVHMAELAIRRMCFFKKCKLHLMKPTPENYERYMASCEVQPASKGTG